MDMTIDNLYDEYLLSDDNDSAEKYTVNYRNDSDDEEEEDEDE